MEAKLALLLDGIAVDSPTMGSLLGDDRAVTGAGTVAGALQQ